MLRDIESDLGGRRELTRIETELVQAFAAGAVALRYLNAQIVLGDSSALTVVGPTGRSMRRRDFIPLNRQCCGLAARGGLSLEIFRSIIVLRQAIQTSSRSTWRKW
jgi:hypothetical protein